jgi:serine/threonine protein kinase
VSVVNPSAGPDAAAGQPAKYGRYKIVAELGRGTMGVVYKAHDPQIDRMVALKVLRPDRVVSQDFVVRFLREAKAIGRISHPGIVTVYDVGQDHGTIYIAMEYLEGRPLNEVIKGRTIPVDTTVDMCVQVAEALGYAHAKGITHRDIKPSNIILTPENRIKLTDFGIARIEDPDAAQQTQAGDILGTPVYMAPEQVKGQKADGRTDLYALGVIAYEMLIGKRPFGGGSIAAIFQSITHEEPPDPMASDHCENRALATLILKSLSKDPTDRFQTGEEMADALKACLNGQAPPMDAAPPDATPQKANRTLRVGLLAVLCVIIAIGIYAWNRQRPHTPPAGEPVSVSAPASQLTVTSTPTGAQIYVDSAFKGTTPMDIPLNPGSYEIRLSMPGYYEWEALFQIDEQGSTPLEVRLVSIE